MTERHPGLSLRTREEMIAHTKSCIVENDWNSLAAVIDFAQKTVPNKARLSVTDIAILAGEEFDRKPGGHTRTLDDMFAYCIDQDGVDLSALERHFKSKSEYLTAVISAVRAERVAQTLPVATP